MGKRTKRTKKTRHESRFLEARLVRKRTASLKTITIQSLIVPIFLLFKCSSLYYFFIIKFKYILGGYPQQQPGYQPVATYPDNPPPYPGPPLENQAVAPPFAAAPPLTKSDYDRQPAYNPN